MKIRLAKKGDCKACQKLSRIKELQLAEGKYISERYFKNHVDKDKMFFVAEDKGKIIGYVIGEPLKSKMAFFSLIAVDKTQRGKGIGKMLTKRIIDRCKDLELEVILFYAPKFNKKTLKFHKKMGFTQGKDHVQFMKIIDD